MKTDHFLYAFRRLMTYGPLNSTFINCMKRMTSTLFIFLLLFSTLERKAYGMIRKDKNKMSKKKNYMVIFLYIFATTIAKKWFGFAKPISSF